MSRQPEIEDAYAGWGERLVAEWHCPYLLTFLFAPLSGSEASMGAQMLRDVTRIYETHVTRVVRKPNSPSRLHERPIWFCSLDRPVFKHAKQSRFDVVINNGLHVHASAFYWPRSRLREDVVEHFELHRDLYVRRGHPLIRIDVEPVTHRAGYVVGYNRKSVGRGFVGDDADLILPAPRVTRSSRAGVQQASMA